MQLVQNKGVILCCRDRLETLKRRLEEVTGLVVDSDKKIEVAKTHKVKATEIFEKARQVIDYARDTKDKAKDLLNTEGSRYLKKAKDQHKKFGEESEKMSQIAREARQLADRYSYVNPFFFIWFHISSHPVFQA